MVWQTGHLLNNGKYEILEVLGRGGFGLTYKARNQDLDMEVVIKTPDILQKRDIEYEEYVKQFQAEGRKLAKFSETTHPHIVRVLYFFTEDQVPCLVMDFIQGQTLMEKVKAQGKLSEAECLKYIRQIGSALEAVHQAGMVHRDAHPGNIMIQPNGNAILIDFGIAKEIIPASSSSTDYAANPSFAPYEQIYKGSKANRQPSVDIFTLAASFYYAVTGEKPTPSMERRLDNRPLKSPKEINCNLSEHINTAITQGMALEKGDRPQSMSDWLQTLELPPPAVEPQYRQEIVNPPPVIKNPQVAVEKKPKKVPWGWLITWFLIHSVTGCSSWIIPTPWLGILNTIVFTIAITIPINGIWAVVSAIVFSLVVSWASGALVVSMMSKGSFSVIWIGVMVVIVFSIVLVVAFLTMVVIVFNFYETTELDTNKLNKNFSRFYSFLILAGTNLSGLGSGWLLGFLLHPKG
jgi:serine/threonine-protein kinase